MEKPQTVEENTKEGREVYVEMVRRGKEVVAVGGKDEGGVGWEGGGGRGGEGKEGSYQRGQMILLYQYLFLSPTFRRLFASYTTKLSFISSTYPRVIRKLHDHQLIYKSYESINIYIGILIRSDLHYL